MGDRNAKCQWQNTRGAKCALRAQVGPKVVDARLPGLLQTSFHVEPVDVDAHQAGSLEREGKRHYLSCNKALVLLVSSKRTEQQEAASGLRLVTKDIIDGLAEADAAAAEKFTAIAYCTVHNLKDFVLDPPRTGKKLQCALAIACSKSATEGQAELIVEQLQLLREADVDVATKCMRQLLLMSSVTATRGPPPGTHAPWTESTAPALQQPLCPALSAYPRGEPWANAPTAPGAYTPAATERILEPLRLRRRALEVSLRIADGRNASAQGAAGFVDADPLQLPCFARG